MFKVLTGTKEKPPLYEAVFLVTPRGVGLGSRVVVTPLGLATASRFRVVAEHRSGVRHPDGHAAGHVLGVTQ